MFLTAEKCRLPLSSGRRMFLLSENRPTFADRTLGFAKKITRMLQILHWGGAAAGCDCGISVYADSSTSPPDGEQVQQTAVPPCSGSGWR